MSEKSPRWPGSNGSPGLDFSRNRRSPQKGPQGSAQGKATQTLTKDKPEPAKPEAEDKTTVIVAKEKPQGTGQKSSSTQPRQQKSTPQLEPQATSTAQAPQTQPKPGDKPPASQAGPQKKQAAAPKGPGPSKPGSARPVQIKPDKPRNDAKAAPPKPAGAPATTPQPAAAPAAAQAPASTASPSPAAAASAQGGTKTDAAGQSSRRTRKARLRLARIDPWSVMKTSFLFSVAFFVMTVVATFVVWSVLAGSGALESVNQIINNLASDPQGEQIKILDVISVERVVGFAALVGAINVVILTAVATLFAFLYNLAATVMGGLEVTLAED